MKLPIIAAIFVAISVWTPAASQSNSFDSFLSEFDALLSAPLAAAAQAQRDSITKSLSFVREVGFDSNGKSQQVNFSFEAVNSTGSRVTRRLSVPILTIVPIPFISFNAKVASTASVATSESGTTVTTLQARLSPQKTSKLSGDTMNEFSLNVAIKYIQAPTPGGLASLQSALQSSSYFS